jgi:hypothetical protein
MTSREFLEALDGDKRFRTLLDPLYVLLEAIEPGRNGGAVWRYAESLT